MKQTLTVLRLRPAAVALPTRLVKPPRARLVATLGQPRPGPLLRLTALPANMAAWGVPLRPATPFLPYRLRRPRPVGLAAFAEILVVATLAARTPSEVRP